MNCQLAWNAERNRYECKCGSWGTSPTIHIRCRLSQTVPHLLSATTQYPESRAVPTEYGATWSRLRQIRSLATELAKWVFHGCPTRTADEVSSIHAICAACPKFVPLSKGGPRCGICGCRTVPADASDAFTLKPLMATTQCPLDPPKWTASAPS